MGSENHMKQEMAPDIEAQTNYKKTDTESPGIFVKANRPVTLKVHKQRSLFSMFYIYMNILSAFSFPLVPRRNI
jgi:hypothetical protein